MVGQDQAQQPQPLPNDVVAYPKLTGLRNQQRPERLSFGSLIDSDNVFLDSTGTLETRFGYEKVISLPNTTDGFSPDHYQWSYLVADGTLYAVDQSLTLWEVKTGLTDETLSWAQLGDRTFYAGNNDCGAIYGMKSWKPLRLPYPYIITYWLVKGSLRAGNYQITATFRHIASGIESPAHASILITTDGAQAIRLDYTPPEGYAADIYLTDTDDTQERWVATTEGYAGGSILIDAPALQHLGRVLEAAQTLTDVFPEVPVTALAAHAKKVYFATYDATTNISFIAWSQVGWPQIFRLIQGEDDSPPDTAAITGKVLGMWGTDKGVLIGTDRDIWLLDDEGRLTEFFEYWVLPGRPFASSKDGTIVANTIIGPVIIKDGQALDAKHKFIPPASQSGSVSVIDFRGIRFSIILTDGVGSTYNKYEV